MPDQLPSTPKQEGFADFLKSMDRGRFADALTEEMRGLVAQLYALADGSGKAPRGKLTITLDMKLDKKALFIDPAFTIKAPKVVRGGTVLFPDAQGRLWPQDPDQLDAFRPTPVEDPPRFVIGAVG